MYRERQEGNSAMSKRNLWFRRNKEKETAPICSKVEEWSHIVRCEGTMEEIYEN
jgi:hypothetical protein